MPYPYTVTIPGLTGAIRQLRSIFPPQVSAETLKKWGIAPNNETYVVNVLKFLGIVDAEGKKVPDAAKVFVLHDDQEFAKGFEQLVRQAYSGLFDDFGEAGWTLSRERLIGFFRAVDHTSATVGQRQANTFQALAGLAGHGEAPAEPKQTTTRRARPKAAQAVGTRQAPDPSTSETKPPAVNAQPALTVASSGTNLTVRIEINLPITDQQDVYDKIFKSIRANLLNG